MKHVIIALLFTLATVNSYGQSKEYLRKRASDIRSRVPASETSSITYGMIDLIENEIDELDKEYSFTTPTDIADKLDFLDATIEYQRKMLNGTATIDDYNRYKKAFDKFNDGTIKSLQEP